MSIAFIDANAGVSGDMLLGALVDAGLGLDGLRQALAPLGLAGYDLEAVETHRCGFRACQVRVNVHDDHHGHGHEHAHGRKVQEILRLITDSALPPPVKERAVQVVQRLAAAEANVHGAHRVEDIHLHEVGAVDAMVDIVGTVAGLARLGVDSVVFSPLRLGFGTVSCAHGQLSIPAPATAELIKGVPVYAGEIEGEMVTPTGAALAVVLAESFGSMPPISIESIGAGAGTADRSLPNILRMFVGKPTGRDEENFRELVVLEANLDDMNPELYDHLEDALWREGALDVWLTPVQMKKGRPGVIFSALVPPELVDRARELFFFESTTLGVREGVVRRTAAARRWISVTVADLPVRVKLGYWQGRLVQAAPEHEECRRAAAASGRPLKEVYQLAVREAWSLILADEEMGDTGKEETR